MTHDLKMGKTMVSGVDFPIEQKQPLNLTIQSGDMIYVFLYSIPGAY